MAVGLWDSSFKNAFHTLSYRFAAVILVILYSRGKGKELKDAEQGCIADTLTNMAYRRFRHIGVDKVKMDFAFFAIAFNIKKMVAKMTKGGLFSYLRAYLTNITPYKLFIRLFFVEKQKLVVHPHKNVQRVFFIYIGSFDTPSVFML